MQKRNGKGNHESKTNQHTGTLPHTSKHYALRKSSSSLGRMIGEFMENTTAWWYYPATSLEVDGMNNSFWIYFLQFYR